eukprot:3778644-Prymnesium_polylepis.5
MPQGHTVRTDDMWFGRNKATYERKGSVSAHILEVLECDLNILVLREEQVDTVGGFLLGRMRRAPISKRFGTQRRLPGTRSTVALRFLVRAAAPDQRAAAAC